MNQLAPLQKEKLTHFALTLIDQQRARVIVPPQQAASGFWFGGGNMIEDPSGRLYLVGRYRDAGDSRTGLSAGKRGWELALFASDDQGRSFEKVLQLAKSDLAIENHAVLSIEGSALHWTDEGVELFVSTEKEGISYPAGLEDHLKPGTGVWTIERLAAPTIEGLAKAEPMTVAASTDPRFVHIKDPFVYDKSNGDLVLLFCSHPYCWTSSNTAYQIRPSGHEGFEQPVFDFFPRGFTWDVAMTRATCLLDVPQVGLFSDRKASLMFYDGGECVRNLDQHSQAVTRARGYSCEELGGVAYLSDGDFSKIERLSIEQPLFISPHGTGCSRYVDVLSTDAGLYATWQQAQADGSQPLVMNFLSHAEVENLLS